MKRLSFIFLALIFFSFNHLNAQTDFQSGFIITFQMDTIYGTIANNDFYSNSQYCEFKRANSDSVIKYSSEKIYGFRFTNGKYYIAKNVELDKKNVRLFVEYLVHGKLDVYFVKDKNSGNHFFVSKDTIPIKELKYSTEIIDVDGKQMLHEIKPYVGILTYLTYDCQGIKKDILAINEPDQRKLVEFAQKYHNLTCKDGKCIVYEKSMTSKMKINLISGFNNYFSGFNLNTSHTFYSFGANFLFQQKQDNEKLFLGIGFIRDGLIDTTNRVIWKFRIPFSINYISNKQGLSPFYAISFDLNRGLLTQELAIGVIGHFGNVSLFLNGGLKTSFVVKPYGYSLNYGIMFDL